MPKTSKIAAAFVLLLAMTGCCGDDDSDTTTAPPVTANASADTAPPDTPNPTTPAPTEPPATDPPPTDTTAPPSTDPPDTVAGPVIPTLPEGWLGFVPASETEPPCIFRPNRLIIDASSRSDLTSSKSVVDFVQNLRGGSLTASVSSAPDGDLNFWTVDFDGSENPLELAVEAGAGVSPDYLMQYTMGWTYGPGSAPVKSTTQSLKYEHGAWSDSPAKIGIVDTGLDPSYPGISGSGAAASAGAATVGMTDEITDGWVAGHGTFIASLFGRWLGTNAHVIVTAPVSQKVAQPHPRPETGQDKSVDAVTHVTSDSEVAAAILRLGPNITHLNLSLGTYGCAGEALSTVLNKNPDVAVGNVHPDNVVPLATRTTLSKLAQRDIQTFAAAGNDATGVPFFPAAFDRCDDTKSVLEDWFVQYTDLAPANLVSKNGGSEVTFADIFCGSDPGKLGEKVKGVMSAGGEGEVPLVKEPGKPRASSSEPVKLPMCDMKNAYSNCGDWYSLAVIGDNVVGWRPATDGGAAGEYTWSGTSFATPCALAQSIDSDVVCNDG